MKAGNNSLFNSRSWFEQRGKKYYYYRLNALQEAGLGPVSALPYTIKILLESVLRRCDGSVVKKEHLYALAQWPKKTAVIPYQPARLILQDFTGVPALVDLASLRRALQARGGRPEKINPEIPVDLIIDHSLCVDEAGGKNALLINEEHEFARNKERYRFLKWAQEAFTNFRVFPPGVGIIHQVNLEYLTPVIQKTKSKAGQIEVYPDTLFGADSHTTMINALGVLGWGVGGIEAEASLLGQPSYFPVPEVIGVRLAGRLSSAATGTDLALNITKVLREKNVVGKFVEFFGPGLASLALADRATVANMAPEYGATCGFFPIDAETLDYLLLTGRSPEQGELVETYSKLNGLFYQQGFQPHYSDVITIDLSLVEPSLAGPKRPQDLIPLSQIQAEFRKDLSAPPRRGGFGIQENGVSRDANKRRTSLKHGALALAAITSCTNTSNPAVMVGAGLLAQKAVEKGLQVPGHVKTSLTPGSRVVTAYLERAGLLKPLEKLGFAVAGYGCATCIGNSGPLRPEVEKALADDGDLVLASVASANRNFEGRIHPRIKANYLASPPLVVAFALAGTVDFDPQRDPLGLDQEGRPVYLAQLWPEADKIKEVVQEAVQPRLFAAGYQNVFKDNWRWNELEAASGALYEWDPQSTYIQDPPFFDGLKAQTAPLQQLTVLAKLGDSVTTDHISPAGAIGKNSAAGRYLLQKGVAEQDFNSYGARRGNHEVMMRGTFGNVRLRNELAPGKEGAYTTYLPTGEILSITEAARRYREEGRGLMVLAGKITEWAAPGIGLRKAPGFWVCG